MTSVGAAAKRASAPVADEETRDAAAAATSSRPANLRLDEPERTCLLQRFGPRGRTELAVDRPRVAVDRVVREVELAADVPLGQAAAEHAQNRQLTLAQRSLAVRAR